LLDYNQQNIAFFIYYINKYMPIINRNIFQEIIKTINKTITVIHGARQVGKTTLMKSIEHYLKKEKNISENQIFYFDLEDFEFLDLCNGGYKEVIKSLEFKGANFKKDTYLFIDEVQYLDNPSSFLKLLADHSQIHVIVSGSSSFKIKSKFKDSLVGRTINYELFGLSFDEFLKFKNKKFDLKNTDKKFPTIIIKELRELFVEYVIFGSYPKVVLEKDTDIKKKIIKQIIETYVRKDIADLADVRDIRKFNNLLKYLSKISGNILNILDISKILNINRETIEKYLFILENTYIIKLVSPFSKSPKTELSKMPKIYFEDTGLMNILKLYDFPKEIDGALFENSIYNLLRKIADIDALYYWRTTHGQEVDFVIENINKLIAIETKLNFYKNTHPGLRSFNERYNTKKSFVCSLDGQNIIYPWQLMNLL